MSILDRTTLQPRMARLTTLQTAKVPGNNGASRGRAKLLHVVPSLKRGGTEQLLYDVLSRIDSRMFDNTICCSHEIGDPDQHKRFQSAGIRTHVLHGGSKLHRVAEMRTFLQYERPEIVHIHVYDGNDIWVRIAAVLAGTPVIMTYDHDIHWAWTGWQSQLAWNMLNRFTRLNVTISDQCRRYRMACCGRQHRKVVKITNGIDTATFQTPLPSEHYKSQVNAGANEDQAVIGAIGRLVAWKRFDLLIQASAVLSKDRPNVHTILRGDGPLKNELEGLAERVGLSGFGFAGWLPDSKAFYETLDIMVATSSPQEGFGLVLAEAMASGVPVIGMADNPTHAEVIGDCGLLVRPDPAEIAKAIARLLDDSTLASTLAKKARKRVEEYFDIRRTALELQTLYVEALAQVTTNVTISKGRSKC